MRFNLLSLLSFFILGYLSLEANAWCCYASSTNSVSLPSPNSPPWYLWANCRRTDGTYEIQSVINLDRCFGNNGGNIVYQPNGGFGGSCRSCTLSGTTMTCTCGNGRGGYVKSSINLNSYVGNNNGGLAC